MSAQALPAQFQAARSALRRHPAGALIAQTAGCNVASMAAAGLGGIVLARAVGPAVRGEYAAITAWFGVLLIAGEAGQSAAVCFYVARDPRRARGYVTTSRAITLVTGTAALTAGILAAPLLARGHPGLAGAYRFAFAGSIAAFAGTSCTFSLQARATGRWNLVCLSQPLLGMAGIIALWRLRLLSLDSAIGTLVVTMTIQLGYAYYWCWRSNLTHGRVRVKLARPLVAYGASQLAAITPAMLNLYLDQLVLSQLVPAADLGRYAVAATFSLIPVPLVGAIGNVAFPRLAAQRKATVHSRRLQRAAMLTSALVASALMLPVAVSGCWLIPLVFGPAYRGAVPLLWLLAPGGAFLACSQVAGDLLRGLRRPGFVAAAQGMAAVCTVILLIALLPSMGVAAAAIATTIAYGVALAVMVHQLWRLPRAGQAGGSQQEGDSCVSGLSVQPGRTAFPRTLLRRCPACGTTR